jgi:ADP-heptose:LPS heptosyltransferase
MIGMLDARQDGRRLALGLLGRCLPRVGNPRGDVGRVLVVRPDHLGDLLFLTPALARLRRSLTNAEIVALVGPWGVPVLDRNPDVDRLVPWDFPWFDRKPGRSLIERYGSLLRLAGALRAQRFDLAVQFRPDFWWGALAVRLAGVPAHVGYDVPTVRPFLTQALPVQHGLHAADENLRLVDAAVGCERRRVAEPGSGRSPHPPPPLHSRGEGEGGEARLVFPITEAERQRARELVGTFGDDRPVLAIQVGAGAPVKLWPVERLAEVARALRDRFGVRTVAIGGAGERAAVERLVDEVGGDALGLAGVTTLGELAAILEGCALGIGPDSGPLHLAVGVGTPTVHLFGPADPRRFGPYGDPTWHRVVQSRWPCCPCDQLAFAASELTSHRCMAAITADEVIEAASGLLRRSLERPPSPRRHAS